MALLTKAQVKDWMKVVALTDDTIFDRLCAAAEKLFLRDVGTIIESASVTEVRDGRGKTNLFLSNQEVTAVAAVVVDGVAIPARTVVTGTGFVFERNGKLSLIGYTFNRGVQNITIIYTAGFSTVPEDITSALIDLVSYWYKDKERIGEISKNIGGEIVQYQKKDVTPLYKAAVDQYKRMTIAL